MKPVVYEVDNRVFLLGLDALYRDAVKRHERGELLSCAREVTRDLRVAPADVPVEGYYVEDEALTEYFLLMRALQNESASRKNEVVGKEALGRLQDVTSSRIYGSMTAGNSLLPAGVDPLAEALLKTAPAWAIDELVSLSYEIAKANDDFSLVALAALSRDPVVLAALRETVVLYAAIVAAGIPPADPTYAWKVDPCISGRATKFIATFNELFDESLPDPVESNAKQYFGASGLGSVVGRCVRIGFDPLVNPVRHYHWAIRVTGGKLCVEDFWDAELWTTQRYSRERATFG